MRVKIRDEGFVRNKAVYIALGVLPDGTKDILGLWIEQTEGAKFWLRVMNDLKGRGVTDILIAVVDGLKGFPEAINAVFPQTVVQTCIVHLIRHSMDFAAWKDRKGVAQALKTVYRAVDANAGHAALDHFAEGPWGAKYPAIAQSWRRSWNLVIPFFCVPGGGPADHLHHKCHRSVELEMRRAVRTRGHFPTDDAATKLLYLALNRAAAEWKRPPRELVRGEDPIRHHVQRAFRQRMMVQPPQTQKFRQSPGCWKTPPGALIAPNSTQPMITNPLACRSTKKRSSLLACCHLGQHR